MIEAAVDEFNELYAETLGITIKTRHWSKSSYAQSGGKPQALLNEQFVNKCDAAVAIFWTRFGTPTDEYGSGTEEEFKKMFFAHLSMHFLTEKRVSETAKEYRSELKLLGIDKNLEIKRAYYSSKQDGKGVYLLDKYIGLDSNEKVKLIFQKPYVYETRNQ